MLLLGLLAAASAIASELPWALSLPLALLAAGEGLRLARRERTRPARELVVAGRDGTASLDGEPISGLAVEWRGPLAFLRFRDAGGRLQRLAWWPDTLDAPARRELRLAVPVQAAAHPARSMAP